MFPKKSAQKAQKAPYRASRAVQIRFLEDEETPAVSPHPANDSNLSHSSPLVIPTGAPKEGRDLQCIGLPHLQAALAVWDYCYASASLLFGGSTGDPIADRIREAIDASGGALSKSQIVRLFHGHIEAGRIDAALETLVASAPWTCVASPPAEDPPPAGPPSQPTNTRKTRNR